ncbi:hypothetical protein ANCDUO_22777 [Ancylostoma duodenale]|uniref:Uncharacterized protein n=1 Tax=Ancylostoma duodenale TaxID=51022 RepID=A0A0C2BTD1_9BILA|nr:hypothetical protein ANCDUO_22777 [Ancylostoma duodenale]
MYQLHFSYKDMCLCGLLSLSLSVHLICCIEVFFSMVLLIQAPDLLAMDGTYFYFLGLLDGGGESLFALHVISKSAPFPMRGPVFAA